ncbi:MAG: hypothetical protein PHR14_06880 [Oscillospiraceae bacterium]|nr:hypothetical protein [Oscillospiraceae bacterium]
MNELSVYNFSSFAICRFCDRVFPSHTPEFTYTFKPGVYALTGQIDNGGWAFTYSLTPLNEDDICIYNSPKYLYDGKNVSIDYIRSISYYLGHYTNNQSVSAKKQLEVLVNSGTVQTSLNEIKDMFGLTEERFDRPLNMTGNEIWRITAAIGLAQGKKIFCYPWMTNNQLKPLVYATQKLADVFFKNNCILFLPVENSSLVGDFVNDIIDLSQPQVFNG